MKADIRKVYPEYAEYLKDESRLTGSAESISFPSNESDIRDTLKYMSGKGTNVTAQGSRTGLAGGAVPNHGHIISLQKMNGIRDIRKMDGEDAYILAVQPGLILKDLRDHLEKEGYNDYFFPPDPTETTASIGGMIACNSSGARSYHYGPTRNYIEGLRVVLSDGSVISLKRGHEKAADNVYIRNKLPSYTLPHVKNASGFYIKPDMDIIDLFIGSEGTLGIISEALLRIIPKPDLTWGLLLLFKEEKESLSFVLSLRKLNKNDIAAIEFFDFNALGSIRENLPRGNYAAAIYVELDGPSEDSLMDTIMDVAGLAEAHGSREEDNILATNTLNMERLKNMRHDIPEHINMMVDKVRRDYPDVTKLGTDMAVPSDKLKHIMQMYREDLAVSGFDSAIFGHIGDNHLHVNIIPGNINEYEQGKTLYTKWAKEAISCGGTISAEHGVGKLKKKYLELMYGKEGVEGMKRLKSAFDKSGIMNIGNLFD